MERKEGQPHRLHRNFTGCFIIAVHQRTNAQKPNARGGKHAGSLTEINMLHHVYTEILVT